MKRICRSLILLLAVGTLISAGCVTTKQVEIIVAESNAAMVESYYQRPDKSLQDVGSIVEKIDSQISAHPENSVLVNHLRVRQAMALTVGGKPNLATQRWSMVEAGELKNEREVALYKSREALVFAYTRLRINQKLDDEEQKAAEKHITSIKAALEDVKTRDIRLYLEMVRAEIGFKLADSMDEELEQAAVVERLANTLNEFVAAYSQDDRNWVNGNWTNTGINAEVKIQELLQRVWLRDLSQMILGDAKKKNLDPPWSSQVKEMEP